ncbi:MAG: polysaccharide biosynthesis protein [Clostridiales bacterium]|nr:polysaccharide biosynthesis protein [Clostridiales bacterium]
MRRKQSFLQGAAVLAAAVAIVKVIGFIGKIPLVNILGGHGLGHYNIAYNIYNVMLTISTAGLPVAVSKMVAEANALGRAREVRKILRVAMSIFLLIGAVLTIGVFVFAEEAAGLMASKDSAITIRAIAPAIFFMTIMSSLRGYYQGLSNMYPTGISQIIEALGKVILGIYFSMYLASRGYSPDVVAAGSVLGMTVGTVIAMLFLILRKTFDRNPPTGTVNETRVSREIAKNILAIAIPITISSGTLAFTSFVDSALVMRRLQFAAGFTEEDARWLYGAFGIAQTMFNFPSAFIVPFAVSVVPAVAAAMSRGDRRSASRTIETAIRVTSVLALPAAAGLSVLSWPIMNLLFQHSPDEVRAAATPLTILAIAVSFYCVVLVSNAVLQSIGKARLPVYTMFIGSVVKIVTNWFLVGIPEININGAPIGTCLCHFTIMVLNLILISREIKPAPNIGRMFGRPLAATIIMAAAAWAVNGLLAIYVSSKIAVLGAIAVAMVIYLILVVLMRAVTRDDLLMLPRGEKIANLLRIR